MLKTYRKIRKDIAAKANTRQFIMTKDGRIVIPLTIGDDSDFLSVFSESDTPVISSDGADYLEEKTAFLPANKLLAPRIRSSCIDPEEQKVYQEAIKEPFFVRYQVCERELKRNALLAVVLAVTGFLALLLSYFVDAQWGNMFWTEVMDIVAWVFVWESVDVLAFRNHELRMERLHCLSFMSIEVEFLPLKQ